MKQLLQRALDALADARRYGAGDWSDLERKLQAALAAPQATPMSEPDYSSFDGTKREGLGYHHTYCQTLSEDNE